MTLAKLACIDSIHGDAADESTNCFRLIVPRALTSPAGKHCIINTSHQIIYIVELVLSGREAGVSVHTRSQQLAFGSVLNPPVVENADYAMRQKLYRAAIEQPRLILPDRRLIQVSYEMSEREIFR